jgi:hypothetical protein
MFERSNYAGSKKGGQCKTSAAPKAQSLLLTTQKDTPYLQPSYAELTLTLHIQHDNTI